MQPTTLEIVKRLPSRYMGYGVVLADMEDIEQTFATETNQLTAERLPTGAAAFSVVLGTAWIFEHLTHPERDLTFGIIFGAEIVCLGGAMLAARRSRWRRHARTFAVVATIFIILLMGLYHVVVVGGAEILAMALLYVVTGTMVLFPWGWQGQLAVASVAVATFCVVVALGAQLSTPMPFSLLGLVTIGALSVGSAAFLARARRAFLHQAADLRAANTALAEANQTKNQFLANVSHELRTPLNVIVGYADLLQQGDLGALPGEALQAVDRVSRSSRSLVYLINDLLDLARIEAGRLEVQVGPVDLVPVFTEMTHFVAARLESTSVRFHAAPSDALSVLADRGRLEQILLNLLSNAVKFTERGDIELRTRRHDDGMILIEVCDTGVGIDTTELSMIFEPFGQGAAGKNRGGVGIGLSLSARLAWAMGGQLTVSSTVGQGSTFTLQLPAAATEKSR